MNKLNDRILNHHVLRKLIEMNLASQSEVRRLIMEEVLNEDPAKIATKALRGLIAQAIRHGDPKKTIVDKRYHQYMPKHIERIKILGGIKSLKNAGFNEDEIKLLSKLIAVYEEWAKTQPTKEPVDANTWDPNKKENAALFKAFKAYAEGFYYAIDPEGRKTSRKQNLAAQSRMVRNLRKTLKAVLKAEAEEAGDKQMAGFAAPDPDPMNEQEGEEPRKLSINNLKASLNMFQSLLSKLDDYLIRWLNAAKKNLKIQREHKRSLIKLIERVQAFAKKIYDFGMDIIKVPAPPQASPQITRNPNLREYVELNQDTIMDATKQVQKVHEKVKDAFLTVILPATKDRNRPYDAVKRACVEVDKELITILKYFAELTKFGEKSGDDVTFDKIQARYKKAFKNLNIPFAIVKRMDDEFIVGKSDPGTIEQTMLEIKDFSVELENIFGVDGIPEESPEPDRPETDEQPPEEREFGPGDWLGSPDSDNDGLTDEEEEEVNLDPENPDTDGDGEGDAAAPQARKLPINNFTQLSRRLIPLFKRPNIAKAITNLGFGAPRPGGNTKLDNLSKFLAYYLVYKQEKTPKKVQEIIVQQAPIALGMSKAMANQFMVWLGSNDKEIFRWFKGSFTSSGNVRKYGVFFNALRDDEMFNNFDISGLSLSTIKQQVSKAKDSAPGGDGEAGKPGEGGKPPEGEVERDNEIKAEIDKIAAATSLEEFGALYEPFREKYAPDRLTWSQVEEWFPVLNAAPEDIAKKISAAGTNHVSHRQKLSDLIKADRAKGPDPADAEKAKVPAQSDPAQAPVQPEPEEAPVQPEQSAEYLVSDQGRNEEGFKLLQQSYKSNNSQKPNANFEKDLAVFVKFIAKYGMSPNMIKENSALKKLADRSSFIGDRTAKVMGAYKSALSPEDKKSVDRMIGALKGANQSKMLNSILRNLKKGVSPAKPKQDQSKEQAKAIRTAAKKVVTRGQAEAPHASLSSEDFLNAAAKETMKEPEVKQLAPKPEEVEEEVMDVILDEFEDTLSPEEKADIEQKMQDPNFSVEDDDETEKEKIEKIPSELLDQGRAHIKKIFPEMAGPVGTSPWAAEPWDQARLSKKHLYEPLAKLWAILKMKNVIKEDLDSALKDVIGTLDTEEVKSYFNDREIENLKKVLTIKNGKYKEAFIRSLKYSEPKYKPISKTDLNTRLPPPKFNEANNG